LANICWVVDRKPLLAGLLDKVVDDGVISI